MKTHLKIAAGIALMMFTGAVAKAQTLADGIRLTENEQYTSAKTVFKKLIAAEPTVGDNYFYFGDLLLKMDDADSALVVFKKGTDVEPSNPLTHVGLGRAYMYTGKVEDGLRELSQADALITAQSGKKGTLTAQKQAVILCELAETYINCPGPNYDKAIDYTNRAEKLDPANADVFLMRGDALLGKDPVNATPAIEAYKKAASVNPKSARANVRIGRVYMAGKNPTEAIKYYNLALASEPNYAPAYAEKGEAWYQLGKFDSASANYSDYLALNPDCYARYRYAAFLYKSGDFDKAIEQGDQVINCDSNLVAVIYRIMGRAHLEKKTPDYAKSIVYFDLFFKKQAITGRPKLSAEDYTMRGKANAGLKYDSLAIRDYRKAVLIDTAKKDVYFDLGNAYYKMKKYDSAAYWYKKKYVSEPNATLAVRVTSLNAFAKALYMNKEYSRSDSAYTAVIGLDSNLTYGWLGRAQSNGKLDNNAEKELARPYYERYFAIANADSVAQKKNSKDLVNASLYLASVHLRAKNYACAKAYYELAAKLDPANAVAKSGLEDKDVKAATAAEFPACVMPPKK
jgi:tetratricopeptide (TPR) repeat protein